jgi:hypothetical protein
MLPLPNKLNPCSSCQQCLNAQDEVALNQEGILAAAGIIKAEAVRGACKPFKYPCKFDNLEHEISFIATMRMLEFGSGYDHILSQTIQKSAKDVVQARYCLEQVSGVSRTRASVTADGTVQTGSHALASHASCKDFP